MKLPATSTSPLEARTATALPWSALAPPIPRAQRRLPFVTGHVGVFTSAVAIGEVPPWLKAATP